MFELQPTDATEDYPWLARLLGQTTSAARRLLRLNADAQPSATPPVPVSIFRKRWDCCHLLAQYGAPPGYVRGTYVRSDRGRAIAAWAEGLGEHQLAAVIQHEAMHAVIDEAFAGPVPHWLHEGFAQCLGDLWLLDAGQSRTVLDPLRLRRLQLMAADDPPASFTAVMHTKPEDWVDNRRVSPAAVVNLYDTSWALAYMLNRTRDAPLRGFFDAWLAALHAGEPGAEAGGGFARMTAARPVGDIESMCRRMFAQPTPAMAVNLDRLTYLGEALSLMHAHQQVMPRTIDELHHRLRMLGFEAAMVVPGRPKVVRPVNDPANYRYVTTDGGETPFDVFPAEDRRTPPTIAAPFALSGPSIEWRQLGPKRLTWRVALAEKV